MTQRATSYVLLMIWGGGGSFHEQHPWRLNAAYFFQKRVNKYGFLVMKRGKRIGQAGVTTWNVQLLKDLNNGLTEVKARDLGRIQSFYRVELGGPLAHVEIYLVLF